MIILFASRKGGTGKTTLATSFATAASAQGRDIILIDADPQRSASRWFTDRTEEHKADFACVEKTGSLVTTIRDFAQRYDDVIIDVAGRDSSESRTALTLADVVVVSSQASQFDLDTLGHMASVIEEARDFNPNLKVHTVLTRVLSNPMVDEKVDAKKYLAEYPELNATRTVIYERKAYRDAAALGKSVLEMDNRKARFEMNALVKEITSW